MKDIYGEPIPDTSGKSRVRRWVKDMGPILASEFDGHGMLYSISVEYVWD